MDHYFTAICRALAFVEENLTQRVSLEAISRHAGFSLWHFQRIFSAYVGEPMGSYLRRRRLTAALDDLGRAETTIIDVALTYQFESHEAFTRAFSAVFGITPSEFRRTGKVPRYVARPQVTPADVRHFTHNITMTPQIIQSPALRLLGLEARFIGPMSPDANNHEIIPPLFGKFAARRAELPPALDGFTYGATACLPAEARSREDELVYLAGISVAPGTPVPAGMKTWDIPARMYAVFQHRGPIRKIDETLNYIYGTWLPRSEYELAEESSIERYDARFCGDNEKSEMDILVPVKAGSPKAGAA